MTDIKIVCSLCKIEKTKNNFYQNSNKANGYASNCNQCVLGRKRKNYKESRRIKKAKATLIKNKKCTMIDASKLQINQIGVEHGAEIQLSFFDIIGEYV
jgi:DeoR/GlpR family transcriptional regulator of sugar metabolism